MKVFSIFVLGLCLSLAAPAMANDAKGVWQTEPDRKGQIAHVEAQPCGAAVCGRIIRTFDRSGVEIAHPNVGKRVFWDMVPAGSGAYSGRAFVPAHNRSYDAEIKVSGNKMQVRGCLGPVCQSQVWTRVR